MQRRLAIALVGTALASILLVGAGVLVLAQVGAREQTEQLAIERMEVLAESATLWSELAGPGRVAREDGPGPRFEIDRRRLLNRSAIALELQSSDLVTVEQSGLIRSLPSPERQGRALGPDAGETQIMLDTAELEAFNAGETVIVDSDEREVRVILAIVPPVWLDLPERTSDATFALTATKEVATVGREARAWFAVSASVVVLGSLLVSWLLARRFTKPILQIQRTTGAIANGDLSARVDTDSNDELGQLGRSVNTMASELERSRALDQQFLMSVSHDLRTPLTAISGYAEALIDGAVDDTAHTGAIINTHAERLERLVGDLLDLARLDANRFQLKLQPLDAAVVVGRTVAGLVPRAESHGLTLRFENRGPTPMLADPDRLSQAVGNLIDNAVKFARSEVVITVSTSGHDAVISVHDDGPGIEQSDLPFIFDRLYVSASQPERAENPSGLGLAIVRELAIAMGGSAEAQSPKGAGTTITIRLPLQAEASSD